MRWWDDFNEDYKMVTLLALSLLIGVSVVLAWAQPASDDRLVTHEVTLGDGTRATCIVVQGVRSAGVTCVPHAFVGHDADEHDAVEESP